MKKNNSEDICFGELPELIDASIRKGCLLADYSDYLAFCKRVGLSSYVLNLLIRRIKDSVSDSAAAGTADKTFFVEDPNIVLPSEESKLKRKIESLHIDIERLRHKIILQENTVAEKNRIISDLKKDIAAKQSRIAEVSARKKQLGVYLVVIAILFSLLCIFIFIMYSNPLFSFELEKFFSI